ncbi:MAG: outer membrane beta-barrel protein [Hydrogenophaga sp.]
MNIPGHTSTKWTLAALALAVASSVHAQSAGTTTTSSGYSVIPYSTNGYIGFNVGKPNWDMSCTGGFACSESSTAYHLYTGGMFNQNLGAEVGYVDFGRSERAGGKTRAHGVNLSLVGHVPLGGLDLYAKVGALYGRTEVTASPLSGVATGKASGWEGTYGVGVGFNLTPRSTVVLEWNRYDLNFVGMGKRDITTTSLGYVHRF